jgi:hypothetical protein
MNQLLEAGSTIALAVVGLAGLSVVLSKNANTSEDIHALASGFGNSVAVAQSPITGNPVRIDLSYPGGGFGGFNGQGNYGF